MTGKKGQSGTSALDQSFLELSPNVGRKSVERVRSRFLWLRDQRLDRIKHSLQHEQRAFLEVLPLIFHVNHPLLPGFVDTSTPAGIAGYQPTRNEILLARAHARSFTLQKDTTVKHSEIDALYLMGSSGSLGQDNNSDLDFWLCYRAELSIERMASLMRKIAIIEAWGAVLGLEVHIFPMRAEAFRTGNMLPLSDDSSGGLGPHLLLEEFYRTGLLIAGLPPLWWLIPPDCDDYEAYTEHLFRHRFVPRSAWLDFGGLDTVPPHEFYGGAHWQLHKSIGSPYKALLKLMLFEAYSSEYPNIDWVSQRIKRTVFADRHLDPDALDPYRLIFERITEHLSVRGEAPRLELARRAFYAKSGQFLTRSVETPDWRRKAVLTLVKSWRWSSAQLQVMDARENWKLDRVQNERNALVAELSRGLRVLTEFTRNHATEQGVNAEELKLLGRKLYATRERRPGKIDRVNPGISRDMSESSLWLVKEKTSAGHRWLLFREVPDFGSTPVKATAGLVELLTWLHVNRIADRSTRLQLVPAPMYQGTPIHSLILEQLQRKLPYADTTPGSLAAFSNQARVVTSILFLDIDRAPDDRNPEPLKYLDHLYVTTWGEILVNHHVGGVDALLDTVCRHFELAGLANDTALHALGLANAQSATLANRVVELVEAAGACFKKEGSDCRYILRLDDQLYMLEWRDAKCDWLSIGDTTQLVEQLGDTPGAFGSVRMDPRALPDSPLPSLLELNRPKEIQIFYRIVTDGIDLWVLDDDGALFEQHLPRAREAKFLEHQCRFYDSLLARRLLASDGYSEADLSVVATFHRVTHSVHGWQTKQVGPPRQTHRGYLEIQLVTNPDADTAAGCTLICGEQEFDSLVLGNAFYRTVAGHVLEHRQSRERYPIYITGVQTSGLETGAGWSTAAMLRIKRRLEKRLNKAIGLDGKTEPDL